jgi:hypothetical protein
MQNANMRSGAENLLVTCGGLAKGDTLLILCESDQLTYYDPEIVAVVAECARALGVEVTVQTVPFDPMGAEPSAALVAAMKSADRTLFLARYGDQMRFSPAMTGVRPIMSYALDVEMLASGFGRAEYHGFVDLKDAVNAMLSGARDIRVTCPLGTDFSGSGAAFSDVTADVTVDRFPMLVFAPVPASDFCGTIVQDGFLVGTGSKFYDPYACSLRQPIKVHFDGADLTDIQGDTADVAAARAHYDHVGQMFGLDPYAMHSWHAGIHPGCAFHQPAASSFERWSGAAFGNPRLLHFHTCGDYAPGEISLNVLDPTIAIDGVEVWSKGRFDPSLVPGGAEILSACPGMQDVFAHPVQEVGLGPDGRLSGHPV